MAYARVLGKRKAAADIQKLAWDSCLGPGGLMLNITSKYQHKTKPHSVIMVGQGKTKPIPYSRLNTEKSMNVVQIAKSKLLPVLANMSDVCFFTNRKSASFYSSILLGKTF